MGKELLLFEDVVASEYEDEIVSDNKEIIEDIAEFDPSSIVVYSRDWTIETMFNQITSKNIDLNPKYQRRNAWTDEKRSKLIESIMIGYPVPEIVLAEDPIQKRSFSVIDGKQRLLTIAGFINPKDFNYWDNKGKLTTLTVKKGLNGVTFQEIKDEEKYADDLRQFNNSALRCTIITNYKENDVLYDIFYRLNSGSVALSTQELRQVLNRGSFADYLIDITNKPQPIHLTMNLHEPDKRFRDIEVILRCLSMIMFANDYKGNLKAFLDMTMGTITKNWAKYESEVKDLYEKINKGIEALASILGEYINIGRKFTNNKVETRFNRVILEVQIFYFTKLDSALITSETAKAFLQGFIELSQNDKEFRSSVESSTKTIDNYRMRFSKFQELTNKSFNANLDVNPF